MRCQEIGGAFFVYNKHSKGVEFDAFKPSGLNRFRYEVECRVGE